MMRQSQRLLRKYRAYDIPVALVTYWLLSYICSVKPVLIGEIGSYVTWNIFFKIVREAGVFMGTSGLFVAGRWLSSSFCISNSAWVGGMKSRFFGSLLMVIALCR